MDVLETSIPQGELTILGKIHKDAINTLVVPFGNDDDGWYFKQFPTVQLAEEFALKYKLIIKSLNEQDTSAGDE